MHFKNSGNENEFLENEFTGGKNNSSLAAFTAQNCKNFKPDEEEEVVADEPISCYNCRYRRWSEKSFLCCKQI